MITCPSCNHQNPEGSIQCENCYTPLPATIGCPNCGASVQTDATFCGQCGFNLQAENLSTNIPLEETEVVSLPDEIPSSVDNLDILPETAMASSMQSPWDDEEDMTIAQMQPISNNPLGIESKKDQEIEPDLSLSDTPDFDFTKEIESAIPLNELNKSWQRSNTPSPDLELDSNPEFVSMPTAPAPAPTPPVAPPDRVGQLGDMSGATQLQIQIASLLHLQSNTTINLPDDLDVIHIGKPNGQIPPDIDIAGFPDSEVVSRIHADIRVEGDSFYIEDVGSSNGTYVNHAPLVPGNRHRLRAGDRIALGKGDLVTFIFQLS
ncbi:FHA domain-containing protein [Chondrocystis sp. NIES-4102]|nr:FHA domain-containing protein [Chondrocystis sp. NIES-4102]